MLDNILLIAGALCSFLSLLICFKHLFSKHIYYYIIPTVLSYFLLILNLYLLYNSNNNFSTYINYIFIFSLLYYVSNLVQHYALKIKIKKNKSRRAMELKEKEALHIQKIEVKKYKKTILEAKLSAKFGYSKPRLYKEVIIFD